MHQAANTKPADKMHSKTYTHIVVGAGSAGCVVAARIVENRNFNVLLLEAGPDCDPNTADIPIGVQDSRRVPMRGQSEIFDPNLNWNIDVTLPDGKSMYVPQARVVGGGSSINGGTALRSTMADSREWVDLGNDAWDFDSVYQVYESLEDDQVRNTHGPHPITRASASEAGKIQRAFLDGAAATGFPIVQNLNATGAEGAGSSPVCRRGDRRISAANTFIDPIRNLPNFTIMPASQVDKVLFSDRRACGVLLVSGEHLQASHEVIICAGAIFSPAILQRSGIGPSRLLESVQIPLISNLPVGENLSDHPCIPIVARPRDGAYQEGDYSLQMQARWSSSQRPGTIDLQMVCFSYLFVPSSDPAGQGRSLAGTATGHVAGIGCNVNKPTSIGKVATRSKDAHEYPTITPNYLQTDDDRRVAREAVRRAYRVMTTPAMQRVLEEPLTLTQRIVEDDNFLDDWILTQLSSTYHFSGSCRMAKLERGGVVDQSGRVHGLRGLRVADASVIPTVPASNTMWTTMMFAERIGCSVLDGMDVKALRGSSKLR
jgi:choline dehydrogenase